MSSEMSLHATSLFGVNKVVALVTGGGTGIGLMIAQALEANGAKAVYIVGRRADVLERAAKTAEFGNIIPHPGDVTSRADMTALVSRVTAEAGRLDVLVHAAGVMAVMHKHFPTPPTPIPASTEATDLAAVQAAMLSESEDGWASQFAVNVTSVYFLTAACLGLLGRGNVFWASGGEDDSKPVAQPEPPRTAQVVTVTGVAGYLRSMGACMGYSASKAATVHLMKMLSTILAHSGIRFNSIAPGIFPTEITAGRGHLDDRNRNHLGPIDKAKVPQGRAGDAADMAGAILFLCGRSGFYVNGSTVVTDGGRLCVFPSTY